LPVAGKTYYKLDGFRWIKNPGGKDIFPKILVGVHDVVKISSCDQENFFFKLLLHFYCQIYKKTKLVRGFVEIIID
jgi:hypothetical protein